MHAVDFSVCNIMGHVGFNATFHRIHVYKYEEIKKHVDKNIYSSAKICSLQTKRFVAITHSRDSILPLYIRNIVVIVIIKIDFY